MGLQLAWLVWESKDGRVRDWGAAQGGGGGEVLGLLLRLLLVLHPPGPWIASNTAHASP